ncbi:MAG: VWA domain-containing protein [Deltaproteobacteria bacterium]|nr:VWA domain-containing protein [Deltaproteobacteria bacterium]
MRLFVLRFLCLIMIASLFGCAEEVPAPKQKAAPSPKQQKAATAQNPQPRQDQTQTRQTKIWPFLKEAQETQSLADNFTARNYILIFDGSGSMRDSKCSGGRQKIEVAKEAVVEWSKTVPGDANLGLISFHGGGWSHLPLSTGQRQDFIRTVQGIAPGGGTPLSRAFGFTYEVFTKQAQRQLGYGEYTLVVVTDGIANSADLLSKYVNFILARTPISIYSIGFCIGPKHSLNQPGRTTYKAADNPAQLRESLREVLAESETFDISEFSE